MKQKINVNSLTKEELKDLKRAVAALGGGATVEAVRNLVSPGKGLTITYMILTFLFMCGLGAILIIPLILAPVSPFFVAWKIGKSKERWALLLPAKKNNYLVELV